MTKNDSENVLWKCASAPPVCGCMFHSNRPNCPLVAAPGELARLPGADPAWARRTRAMARAFTNALRLDRTRDAYVWTYELPRGLIYRGWGEAADVSDHNPVQSPRQGVEDLKHASLDFEIAF